MVLLCWGQGGDSAFPSGRVSFPGPQRELLVPPAPPATAHTAPALWVEVEPGLACLTWKLLEGRSLSSLAHYAQVQHGASCISEAQVLMTT